MLTTRDPIKKLSADSLVVIAKYLVSAEKVSFFSASKYLQSVFKSKLKMIDDKYVTLRLKVMLRKAAQSVEEYRNNFSKADLSLVLSSWKGENRALHFYDILTKAENKIEDRIFALYVLLRESNGKVLKSMVREKLVANFGKDYFTMIEAVVRNSFTAEVIARKEKELLVLIHEDVPDHEKGGFMQAFIEGMSYEQAEQIKLTVESMRCAIS